MAAAQILAAGTGAADSTDQTVTSNLTVGLKGTVDGQSEVIIKIKDDGGAWIEVDRLNQSRRTLLIQAPGTYRFSRAASATSYGVFSA